MWPKTSIVWNIERETNCLQYFWELCPLPFHSVTFTSSSLPLPFAVTTSFFSPSLLSRCIFLSLSSLLSLLLITQAGVTPDLRSNKNCDVPINFLQETNTMWLGFTCESEVTLKARIRIDVRTQSPVQYSEIQYNSPAINNTLKKLIMRLNQ